MPSPPAAPTTSGVDAAEFLSDPAGAVRKVKEEIRAEVRKEIIGANILFLAIAYFLIKGDH